MVHGGHGLRVSFNRGSLGISRYMGVSQNSGYLFGGPHNKDYSILGSILGSLYLGKLPYVGIFGERLES